MWLTIKELAVKEGVSKQAIDQRLQRKKLKWRWGKREIKVKEVWSDTVKHNIANETKKNK